MKLTETVKHILSQYESDNPGTKSQLSRILMNGKLAGTGKMVILPVDQGFEHGPARSFAPNPDAYDPYYHYEIAIEAGLNAYAAPLGMLEVGADRFAGCIPTILKVNSSNSLTETGEPDQAVTATVTDALRLGCSAIGFTIYPGSEKSFEMMEEVREMILEAKSCGLAAVVWSYPRGNHLSKSAEVALDVVGYAAHMAALLGAHIIKVKPPVNEFFQDAAKQAYQKANVPSTHLADRIKHIVDCCFKGKRLVVFSGGAGKNEEEIFTEARAIRDGGGNGSIIGRNTFQRPREEALKLLADIMDIYKGKK